MNFSQLKYIIAVEKHRNFSRAAAECDVSQSTLSKEIQRLEQELDVILFDRSRYPIVPTMKGLDLIHQAKKIGKEEEKFREIAQQKENQPVGSFTLGISNILAPYLLPLFIQKISKKYPKLNLKIEELTPHEMVRYLQQDKLDGAIGISPFEEDGFYERQLFEENFVLYVSPDHPLAKKEEVAWQDISLDELLLHQSFKEYLLSSNELIENEVFSIHKIQSINYQNGSLETMRKIIDRNGGITILPQLSTLYMGQRRIKMVRPIVQPTLSRMISFFTPRGFEKKRITKVIQKSIIDGLADLNFKHG